MDDFAVADLSLSVAESVRERREKQKCFLSGTIVILPSSPTTHRASVDDSISQELESVNTVNGGTWVHRQHKKMMYS